MNFLRFDKSGKICERWNAIQIKKNHSYHSCNPALGYAFLMKWNRLPFQSMPEVSAGFSCYGFPSFFHRVMRKMVFHKK